MSPAEGPAGVQPIPGELAGFFDALDRQHIAWSLLRPREGLALRDGDVDVLVEPHALDPVRELVKALGFSAMPVPGPDIHASTYDEADGRFVWLHVQGELRLAGEVVAAREVLDEADREGLRQPGDRWLLWILLLRALVDKGELPGRHRAHVERLAQAWEGGPAALESLARRRGLDPARIVAAAAAADWEALLAQRVPPAPAPATPRARRLAGRLARGVRGLRGLRSRRGLSVAVLGPDGAGKTTLIEGLAESLPLTTRVQYMGLTGGRLPRADALRLPGLVLAARIMILWLRYGRAMYHRARGEIVLFDRYTLDGAVPSGMPLSRAGRLSRRVQRRVCPMPDLVLLLDASGETMHARKGEYDATELERWRAAYAGLRGRVAALELIDAERPIEAVRRDAESLIWRRYAGRR